ncbi:protein of unknown function [Methylocaldum szegediense]|uniref:Transposase n=1 Tax=Methylocaldum szegediense TaxID=73780 RepID=A0ABM9I649_9GAMM|nr:protein of unknown function [Methylocaldum szegediense]
MEIDKKQSCPAKPKTVRGGRTKSDVAFDVVYCLLDSRDLFRVFVGNLTFKLFFQRHHQFDRV